VQHCGAIHPDDPGRPSVHPDTYEASHGEHHQAEDDGHHLQHVGDSVDGGPGGDA